MKPSKMLFLRCLWRYPLISNHYLPIAGIIACAMMIAAVWSCVYMIDHETIRRLAGWAPYGEKITPEKACFFSIIAWQFWRLSKRSATAENLAYPNARISLKGFLSMPGSVFTEALLGSADRAILKASAIAPPGSSILRQVGGLAPLFFPGLLFIESLLLLAIMFLATIMTGFAIMALAAGHVSWAESNIFYKALPLMTWLAASIKGVPWRAAAKRRAEETRAKPRGSAEGQSLHWSKLAKKIQTMARSPARLRERCGDAVKGFAGRVMEEAGKSEALSLAEREELSSAMGAAETPSKKPPRL